MSFTVPTWAGRVRAKSGCVCSIETLSKKVHAAGGFDAVNMAVRRRSRKTRYCRNVVRKNLTVSPPGRLRSEEHTSELQSLMRIAYAVLCLKKKKRRLT